LGLTESALSDDVAALVAIKNEGAQHVF